MGLDFSAEQVLNSVPRLISQHRNGDTGSDFQRFLENVPELVRQYFDARHNLGDSSNVHSHDLSMVSALAGLGVKISKILGSCPIIFLYGGRI